MHRVQPGLAVADDSYDALENAGARGGRLVPRPRLRCAENGADGDSVKVRENPSKQHCPRHDRQADTHDHKSGAEDKGHNDSDKTNHRGRETHDDVRRIDQQLTTDVGAARNAR
ncbi:hypothetical protein Asi02nite_69420 [Asanoa siamensis]|uniref:Transposase n=1 Tax=Asanoa siamensis TaxID=926357 RepID=A0ABQ4D1M2_9ACTN|nr:hypothetical protein Asi02nite_69420 [Asanoa siamensis]